MNDRSQESIEQERPTLIGAVLSFAGSMALVVLLVALAGGRNASPEARAAATGTYVLSEGRALDGADQQFAAASLALRFRGPDKLEMKVGGRVFEAFYRVEGDRLLIERLEGGAAAGMWIFEIDDGRLVSPESVLERAER